MIQWITRKKIKRRKNRKMNEVKKAIITIAIVGGVSLIGIASVSALSNNHHVSNSYHQNYVDINSNTECDNKDNIIVNNCSNCGNYIDANNDGLCDNCSHHNSAISNHHHRHHGHS